MANLTTLLYPVSTAVTNVVAATLEVNTNNCVLSSTGMPNVPALSSRFTDSGVIMCINGASYNTETSYLQIRVNNNDYNNATLVMSKILPPNENFEITIPYGIRGNPFHIIVCDSPVQPTLTENQTFFSVNYKK